MTVPRWIWLVALLATTAQLSGCMDCHGSGYDPTFRPPLQPHQHPDAPK